MTRRAQLDPVAVRAIMATLDRHGVPVGAGRLQAALALQAAGLRGLSALDVQAATVLRRRRSARRRAAEQHRGGTLGPPNVNVRLNVPKRGPAA